MFGRPARENQRQIEVNEISCLAHGIFNLGFFALRAGDDAKAVVDFWSDRLRKYCYRDHASGLFTDQKWANFFPVFFDCVHVMKERTLNISSWDLVNVNLVGAIPELYSDGTRIGFSTFLRRQERCFHMGRGGGRRSHQHRCQHLRMVQESAARDVLAVVSSIQVLSDLPQWTTHQEKPSDSLSQQRRFFRTLPRSL